MIANHGQTICLIGTRVVVGTRNCFQNGYLTKMSANLVPRSSSHASLGVVYNAPVVPERTSYLPGQI